MSGDPVVVLWAGVVPFFFDPVAFGIGVRVFLDADLGDALVDEIYLPWGPMRGGLTSLVVLCSFDAAEAHFVLVFWTVFWVVLL